MLAAREIGTGDQVRRSGPAIRSGNQVRENAPNVAACDSDAYAALSVTLQRDTPSRGRVARRAPSPKRWRGWVSLAAIVASALASSATGSHAAPNDNIDSDALTMSLVSQTSAIRLKTSPLSFTLAIDNAPDDTMVEFVLHDRVTSQLEFDETNATGALPKPIDSTVSISLSKATKVGSTRYTLRVPVQIGTTRERDTLLLPESGVYPIEIAARSDSTRSNDEPTIVTWIIVNDASEPPNRVDVAPLVRISATETIEPMGATTANQLAAQFETLDQLDLPLTIEADPTTLLRWRDASEATSESRAAFRSAMEHLNDPNRHVLGAPLTTLSTRQLASSGLTSLYGETLVAGNRSLNDLGLDPNTETLWLSDATIEALEIARAQQVTKVVITESSLQSIDAPLRNRRFRVRGSDLDVVATDTTFVPALFDANDDPAIRVQRFIAGLRIATNETPGASIVLAIPQRALNDTAFINLIEQSIAANSFINTTSLDMLIRSARPSFDGRGGTLLRNLDTTPSTPLQTATRVLSVQRALNGYTTLVGAGDATVAQAENEILASVRATTSVAVAHRHLDRVTAMIDAFTSNLGVSARAITLTSASSKVPFSFTNRTGKAVRVKLVIEGNPSTAKLKLRDSNAIVTIPPSANESTQRIAVEVRSSGTFPVQFAMTTVDGSLRIGQPSTLRVRSTVFGKFGSVLTFGALSFLALWWVHHIVKRRRA